MYARWPQDLGQLRLPPPSLVYLASLVLVVLLLLHEVVVRHRHQNRLCSEREG